MLHIVLDDVFDSGIIDHQGERNWSSLMTPQAGGMCTLIIPKRRKFLVEALVC
jgi:hypothetical protein